MKLHTGLMCVTMLSAAVACDKPADTTVDAAPAANDTKVNARDRGATVTPMDQGNAKVDIDTTADIRKAVVADDTLSMDAKNAKIITNSGTITLRGPVKSMAEHDRIETIAKAHAGSNRVDNQLETTKTP